VDTPRLGPVGASTTLQSLEQRTAPVPPGVAGAVGMRQLGEELTAEARRLLRLLVGGTSFAKFSNGGKGPLQSRCFWTKFSFDLFTGELCWTKDIDHYARAKKTVSSAAFVRVEPGLGLGWARWCSAGRTTPPAASTSGGLRCGASTATC
jgi:hypothetical protein